MRALSEVIKNKLTSVRPLLTAVKNATYSATGRRVRELYFLVINWPAFDKFDH